MGEFYVLGYICKGTSETSPLNGIIWWSQSKPPISKSPSEEIGCFVLVFFKKMKFQLKSYTFISHLEIGLAINAVPWVKI